MTTAASSRSLLVGHPYATVRRSCLGSLQRYGIRGTYGRKMMQTVSEYGVCES
jgi:hypothetical protein